LSVTKLWSCGGGTQSAAMAALIIQGRIEKPDAAVMVDTEREKSQTWRYMRTVVQPALSAFGLTVEVVSKSEFATVDIYALNGDLLLPVFTSDGGRLSGFCSNEWKRRVVQRWCRSKGYDPVENWLGYSLDEAKRVKSAEAKWWQPRYPLIELRLRRSDCIQIVEAMGWPTPPRSACWMCPHMTNAEWRQMQAVDPADFQRAIVLDELIREEDANVFVHRSGKPLRDADLGADDGQGVLFGCDSGQCFV
jgi:hypothetical protein